MAEKWVYRAVLARSVRHLLALAYAYRNRPGADGSGEIPGGSAPAVGEGATGHAHGETVECRECGAIDARGYRFCRRCVTERTAGISAPGQSTRTEGRRTL